uniref:B-cell receptor CD22 n=1 Tax=Seriola dumerili TaxID=41447 RepID=A0A3B4UD71_SERDU
MSWCNFLIPCFCLTVALTGASVGGRQQCLRFLYGYCITLPEGEITAEAGLCVVIPCSFTTSYSFTPQKLVWYKCEPTEEKCSDSDVIFHTNKNNIKIQSEFRGRVSQLEPDVSQRNCSIIINDLKESDSGSYQFRVNGILNGRSDGLTYPPRHISENICASVGGRQQCLRFLYGYCITLPEGEITAEAGLCVVIPCSFTTSYSFTPQKLVWYKCEPTEEKCSDSDVIFHTNKNNIKIQSEFRGRVSQLEPDVSQRNCSIIINDLKESDSGSYQFRVNGILNGRSDGLTYPPRATVSIKALTQKPEVTIPPLTEGQQTTLTCTAPGLCSGSDPQITWTWRGSLSAVTQKHSSNLTFNPSAEHHGTSVTCKVKTNLHNDTLTDLQNDTETYLQQGKPGITGDTTVKKGSALNLTCSLESFPPSLITWTKLGLNTNLHNGTNLQSNTGSARLLIPNVTAEDSGQYVCTAKHLDTNVTIYADVTQLLNQSYHLHCTWQIHDGQAVEDDQTHGRKGAEDAAVAAEKTAPVLDTGPKDVEYASIDFSLLKRRSLRQAAKKQETAETEYAEIKKEVKEEREDDGGEEGEMLEGKEERVMKEEDEETKCCVPGEEEGEDMAVYSNVKDIMGEM